MNLQTKKLELVQMILNTDCPLLLDKVRDFVRKTEETIRTITINVKEIVLLKTSPQNITNQAPKTISF